MTFCPVVPDICRGQVHASRKERIRIRIRNGAKTISPKLCLEDLIRNGAKTISLQTLFGRLNYTIKSTIDAMKYSNTIQLSPFKCNHVYCYIVDKMINVSGNRLKYLMIFNRGIDTMKITALSNHKPGILNTYIRIDIIACKY